MFTCHKSCFTCHKSCCTCHKSCFTCHKVLNEKLVKIIECEIWCEIFFVKRIFFVNSAFPNQTGPKRAVRVDNT